MALLNRRKNWEDDYDEYYAQDRRPGPGQVRSLTRLRFFTHALTLMFVGAVFLGVAGTLGGPSMLEKMLTDQQCHANYLAHTHTHTFFFFFFFFRNDRTDYFCLLTRQPQWQQLSGFACWLILTLAGNSYVSNWLISTLESPYQKINVLAMEPLDTIVVLGRHQFTFDWRFITRGQWVNVSTACRLFHAGKVANVICTGGSYLPKTEFGWIPRQEAAEILIGLGVPPANVVQMKGRNTSEEMHNLKTWMEANPNHGRVNFDLYLALTARDAAGSEWAGRHSSAQ